MSEEATTPPRKVGSLRDRIAQFEAKPAAPAPPPKPTVAKKSWAWKEKQAEAQSNQAAEPAVAAPEASSSLAVAAIDAEPIASSSSSQPDQSDPTPKPVPVPAGMSAEDAKAAISQGGGLKARLAALQGSGFGATPAEGSAPPPPPGGKPRVWKKVVVPHEPIYTNPPRRESEDDEGVIREEEEQEAKPIARHPDESETAEDTLVTTNEEPEAEEEEAEKDPEEEERQRRAAIAARMARLGGARVGMGMPPVIGKKPVPTPPRKPSAPPEGETSEPAPARARSPPPRAASPERAAPIATPFAMALPKQQPTLPREEPRPESESISEQQTETETETDATRESTVTDTADDGGESSDEPVVAPVPTSPPRSKPPVPVARSWSTSPKPGQRPEIVSQGSSFSIPRSVYDYPPWVSPLVPRASGGVAVADHLKRLPPPPSPPVTTSPLTLSPVSASSASSGDSSHARPSNLSSPMADVHRTSHRHSDSALRSSMITDEGAQLREDMDYYDTSPTSGSRFFEPQQMGPRISQMDPASRFQSAKALIHRAATAPPKSPPASSPEAPDFPAGEVYLYDEPEEADLATLYSPRNQPHVSNHTSPSFPVPQRHHDAFYPRPLSRSLTPPSLPSTSSSSSRFRFFGWLKKRQLTDSLVPQSSSSHSTMHARSRSATNDPYDTVSLNSGSGLTPAARIKSKYQIAAATANPKLDRSQSLRRLPPPPTTMHTEPDVMSINSPVDDPPPRRAASKKLSTPPPRPARPYSPSPQRSVSPAHSAPTPNRNRDRSGSLADSIQSRNRSASPAMSNGTRYSPNAPFSTRKPSFSGSDVVSMPPALSRTASLRSNISAPFPVPTAPHHIHSVLPAPNGKPSTRGVAPVPIPMHMAAHLDDVMTPVSDGGMTWFDTDFEINRK